MPLAALLWLVLQLAGALSAPRDASWTAAHPGAAAPRAGLAAWCAPAGPAGGAGASLRDAARVRMGAPLPATTIALPRTLVRVDLRSVGGPRPDDAPAPPWPARDPDVRAAAGHPPGWPASHALAAHGARLPYYPTAPPLHS